MPVVCRREQVRSREVDIENNLSCLHLACMQTRLKKIADVWTKAISHLDWPKWKNAKFCWKVNEHDCKLFNKKWAFWHWHFQVMPQTNYSSTQRIINHLHYGTFLTTENSPKPAAILLSSLFHAFRSALCCICTHTDQKASHSRRILFLFFTQGLNRCTPLHPTDVVRVKVTLNASYKFTNHGNQFWTTKKFHIKVQLRATSTIR